VLSLWVCIVIVEEAFRRSLELFELFFDCVGDLKYAIKSLRCVKVSCQESEIKRYLRKVSGPVADRIAIHLELGHELTEPSTASTSAMSWTSARATVARIRKWNLEHHGDDRFSHGPQMTPKAADLLHSCRTVLKLSHRGLHHVRNVALTAALVDDSPSIELEHIAEAGASRLFDRKTWLR